MASQVTECPAQSAPETNLYPRFRQTIMHFTSNHHALIHHCYVKASCIDLPLLRQTIMHCYVKASCIDPPLLVSVSVSSGKLSGSTWRLIIRFQKLPPGKGSPSMTSLHLMSSQVTSRRICDVLPTDDSDVTGVGPKTTGVNVMTSTAAFPVHWSGTFKQNLQQTRLRLRQQTISFEVCS